MTLITQATHMHSKNQLKLLIFLIITMGIVMLGQSLPPKTCPNMRRPRDKKPNDYLPTALEQLRKRKTLPERIDLARASLRPTLGLVIFQKLVVKSNNSLPVNSGANKSGGAKNTTITRS